MAIRRRSKIPTCRCDVKLDASFALSQLRKLDRDLRCRALEQCDAHLAFLRQLDGMGMLPEDLPQDELTMMAALDGLFNRILEALEHAPGRDGLRMLEDSLGDMEERWEMLVEQFGSAVEADEDWEDEDWEDNPSEAEVEGPVKTCVFKVKFKYAKRIWRKVEVAEQQTLHHLHLAIQDAVGWDDDHL